MPTYSEVAPLPRLARDPSTGYGVIHLDAQRPEYVAALLAAQLAFDAACGIEASGNGTSPMRKRLKHQARYWGERAPDPTRGSYGRAVAVLAAAGDAGGTAQWVAERAGLSPATVRHWCRVGMEAGLVAPVPRRKSGRPPKGSAPGTVYRLTAAGRAVAVRS